MKKLIKPILCAGILVSGTMAVSDINVHASEYQIEENGGLDYRFSPSQSFQMDVKNDQIIDREKRSGTTVIGKYHHNNRTKSLKNKLKQRFGKKYKEPNGHAMQRAFERGISDDDILNTIEHGNKYKDSINNSTIHYLATTGIAVAEGYDVAQKEYFLKTVISDVLKPGSNWQPIS
ncbi:DUF4258 domain-containing protein [Bacillus cereus group sp. N6]|uniref:DUF4258 domain-containing protein n=1 Tax=Bacillus cereus group sp. N6 TaxID=2794583 RepID=UPI0018F7172D|nr:DUF4258 domain-containing protein [Bacillus cereus group sp. N6]MBJ8113606.1 DUF4258 domain-containing protein [Bacillus cereus group sp. N6]